MDDQRLNLLLSLKESNSTDSFVFFALAKEFEKRADLTQARHYYEQVLSLDPEYLGLYYHLGKLQEAQGQYDEAIETYRAGMTIARKQNDTHALSELAGAKLNLTDED
jgi:tetratricopeptide (TPR) repeat protein